MFNQLEVVIGEVFLDHALGQVGHIILYALPNQVFVSMPAVPRVPQ